jgi:hypothetical protein
VATSVELNALSRSEWNGFLLRQAHSHPWHTWDWTDYLVQSRGRKAMRISLHDERGGVLGLYVIILEPAFPLGIIADSIPMYHFSGPILDEDMTSDQLQEAHRRLAAFVDWKLKNGIVLHSTTRICEPELKELSCLKEWEDVGFTVKEGQTFTYLVPVDEGSIMGRYDHDFRNQVRQGARKGGTVEVNPQVDANTLYGLYLITMKEAGLKPRYARKEVASLIDAPGSIARDVYVCKYQGRPVAFAVCLTFGRTAIYWLAGMDRRFKEVRPNNLLVDEIIRNSLKRGICRIDFGGAARKGLHDFKSSIGAKPTQVFVLEKTYSRLFALHRGYTYVRSSIHDISLN